MTVVEQGQTRCRRSLSRAFALRAAALCAAFLVAHLLGLRQYTSVLSGTAAFGFPQLLRGVVYITFYVLFVVWVPVLLIAAALARVVETWRQRRATGHDLLA